MWSSLRHLLGFLFDGLLQFCSFLCSLCGDENGEPGILGNLFSSFGGGERNGGMESWFGLARGKMIMFDNGTRVRMGKLIAEGGFSYVFEAVVDEKTNDNAKTTKSGNGRTQKCALKRIHCCDHELIQSCRHEAGIHRMFEHDNLMPLLGLKFDNDANMNGNMSSRDSHHTEYNVCYMLFPLLPKSLRGEITARNLLFQAGNKSTNVNNAASHTRPFSTVQVLHLFRGIMDAITTMHEANISHRDLKLENILLSQSLTPVLMDFGSAGALERPLSSRSEIMTIVEKASMQTTMPYRPPELFEGGLSYTNSTSGSNQIILNYGKVDVWSLGCVLFGIMHGSSPFETELVRKNYHSSAYYRGTSEAEDVVFKIVECTHLKILEKVPLPPWAENADKPNPPVNEPRNGEDGRYPSPLYHFVRYMVQHDLSRRPTILQVQQRFYDLCNELSIKINAPFGIGHWSDNERSASNGGRSQGGITNGNSLGATMDVDRTFADFDSLLSTKDFV